MKVRELLHVGERDGPQGLAFGEVRELREVRAVGLLGGLALAVQPQPDQAPVAAGARKVAARLRRLHNLDNLSTLRPFKQRAPPSSVQPWHHTKMSNNRTYATFLLGHLPPFFSKRQRAPMRYSIRPARGLRYLGG